MKLISILQDEHVLCQHTVINKKLLLEELSELFTINSEIDKSIIFDEFIEREQLGSTALGQGVAIPHIRSALFTTPQLAIIQLKKPIEFDAPDKHPVDIIVALIATLSDNSSHLNLLAECSSLLSQSDFRNCLRQAQTPQEIISYIKKMVSQLESV